jgi:carboxylesterase
MPLVDALRARGVTTACPILPGHEGPGPHMGEAGWEDWVAAAEAAFDELASVDQPVAVVGFSTGATLALLLAMRRPVSRLVLIAPFLAIRLLGRVPGLSDVPMRWLARFVPRLPRRGPAALDPEARRGLRGTDRFETFCLRATVSALELIEHVKPLVGSIDVPTLILQGRWDTVVEPSGATWLYQHLGGERKVLLWLEHSDHLVALDRDRDAAITAAVDWLTAEQADLAGPNPA